MDCYIYFKAAEHLSAQIIAFERELQTRLQQEYDICGTLQRRPDTNGGVHTWMEIYRDVPENFSALLQKILLQTQLQDLQYSERHAEYFMNVEVCA